MQVSPGSVVQDQRKLAGTRKGDLDPRLLSILQQLASELNIGILVVSGGQAVQPGFESYYTKQQIENYKKIGRTGSNRHNAGEAADIRIFAPGIGTEENGRLNDNNPAEGSKEYKLLQKFVALGKTKGLKGFGSGEGYMDGGKGVLATFHVDIVGNKFPGTALMWGKDLASVNAPDWMVEAYKNPQKFLHEGSLEEAENSFSAPPPTPPVPTTRPAASSGSSSTQTTSPPIPTTGEAASSGSSSSQTTLPPLPNIRPEAPHRAVSGQRFGRKIEDSYYAPIRENNLYIKSTKMSEAAAASIRKALDLVLQGSNESNYATHNAYGGSSVADNALEYGTEAITIDYGGGKELFYNKNKDDADSLERNGATYVKREKAWLASKDINRSWVKEILDNDPQLEADLIALTYAEVGGTSQKAQQALLESLFNRVRAHKNSTDIYKEVYGIKVKGNTKSRSGKPKNNRKPKSDSDSTNGISDSLLSLGVSQFLQRAPGLALTQIEGALGSDLSFMAQDVMSSIESGSGIPLLKSLVSEVSAGETIAQRVEALSNFAMQNEEVAKTIPGLEEFLPALPVVSDLLGSSPRDRARLILENKDLLGGLGLDTSIIPDEIPTEAGPINLLNLLKSDTVEQGKLMFLQTLAESFGSDDKKQTIEELLRFLEDDQSDEQARAIEYLQENKEKLGLGDTDLSKLDFLTMTPQQILESPEIQGALKGTGEYQQLVESLLDPGSDTANIEEMVSKLIEEKTSLSLPSSRTLAFGGSQEAVKKLQSDVGSVAFEGLVESFPILGQIIGFFTENQGILALLASAGAAAGLSSLLGGGLTGSLLGGAGAIAGTRLILGKEGYEQFQNTIGEGMGQVTSIFRDVFKEAGLMDQEVLGPILDSFLGFSEKNPVATLMGATGNFGGAVGAVLAEQGIKLLDDPSQFEKYRMALENIFETRAANSSESGAGMTSENSDGGVLNSTRERNSQNNDEMNDGAAARNDLGGLTGSMWKSTWYQTIDSEHGFLHGNVNV